MLEVHNTMAAFSTVRTLYVWSIFGEENVITTLHKEYSTQQFLTPNYGNINSNPITRKP